ncbi:hypothetical protein BRC86_14210 [Halobacteriales archaeon QS_3_64_16]|nr:MAG: hypothetical protein BRC86_14210 [Halobacteriales archaeon QS_3_64_16]
MPGTKTISLSLDEELIEALDEEIAPHDISRTEYIRYIIEVRHDRAEHERELDRANERIEELREELEEARARVEKLQAVTDERRRERDELREELEHATERIEEIKGEYEDEAARAEELRKENEGIRHERDELEADLERTESRVETLLQQADEAIDPRTEGRPDSEPTGSRTNVDGDGRNGTEDGSERRIERTNGTTRNGPVEKENEENTENGNDELAVCAAQLRSYLDEKAGHLNREN